MYSMVLMAALTTGSNAPDCGLLRGCGHASYSCTGCTGSSGCWGGATYANGGGCWGACYGSGYYGAGCYGSGYYGGCYGGGGYGSWGYGGAGSDYAPRVMPPADGKDKKDETKDKESALPDKARLIVEVPVNAKLYIDEQLMKSTATTRSFSTPTLEVGQSYYYDVRVEVVRDGKTYEGSKRVVVRAGEQTRASFNETERGSALSVKLEPRR
jgi:uncharacterized protein (TIGR03000 family)